MHVLLMFIKDDLDVCTCLHASCIMVVIDFLNRLKTFTSRDSSNETTTHDSKTSFNLDAGADLLQRYKLICSLNPLFFYHFHMYTNWMTVIIDALFNKTSNVYIRFIYF